MNKKYKPTPAFLPHGHDLIYKCGVCEYGFNMSDYKWKFCPMCGKPIDWGVIVRVNEEWSSKYFDSSFEERKALLNGINEVNKTLPPDKQMIMNQTPLTKLTILKRNISYYINQGYTKEELIKRGFFTQEDFEEVENGTTD